MYILLLIVHVVICLVLIAVILLQAGRGAGFAEMFGGNETAQSVLGSQASVVLKRATEVCALAFLLTSLLLGIITARRGRSLFTESRLPAMPGQGQPVATRTASTPVALPDAPEAVGEDTMASSGTSETPDTAE